MNTEEKVLLLALLKKEEGEGVRDIMAMLANSQVFSMKEGKKMLKSLKSNGFISNGELTPKGIAVAKEIETEFKL